MSALKSWNPISQIGNPTPNPLGKYDFQSGPGLSNSSILRKNTRNIGNNVSGYADFKNKLSNTPGALNKGNFTLETKKGIIKESEIH